MRLPRFQFKLRTLMIAVAIIAVGLASFFYLSDFFDSDPMGRGSPVFAEQWKKAFEILPNLEAAKAKYPQVVGKQFDDGSWVFGVELDSHGHRDGGTVVVKDSDGHIRAFFGHVCGDYLPQILGPSDLPNSTATSLTMFYQHSGWQHWRFKEYQFK